MNIEEPLTTLRKLLEHRLSCSLADHEFYLQDSIKVKKEYNRKLEKFSMNQTNIDDKAKKLIICFSFTARVTFNPPAPKIFIAFPVFTLKIRLYIVNCQFKLAIICPHFVCFRLVG